MDVGDWLRSVGLGQYEALFRENEIDDEVLPEVTEVDLEKFGVPFGHRKRLLKAIAGIGITAAEPKASAPEILASPVEAAERRQLTIMFCDLVGSTALSARLDPEDMRAIIGAYHKCCASLIESNGGFVAKYMGDGVLAYFGYPHAHEHDAERSVRTGLAIVEAAPKLETPVHVPLHVRIGIATGIVVVGDLLGSGESQERGVVGDTPNLAARLQSIAAPDNVVIAEGTRKLLGDLFELSDLGQQELKGIAGPTRAWTVLRQSAQESRFEALQTGGFTPLVGREEENDLLVRRWAKAKEGDGQVVLLSGEAGIGKSRLTAAFLQQMGGEQHTRMRYFCSPQHTDSVLYPIIGHMERAAGFTREDDATTKLDKLDTLLAASAKSREDVALIAEMLSLPNDGRHAVIEMPPALRRQKTMEVLVSLIEVISRQTPVLMLFEDAHWADPSSLELLGRLVDRIAALRVLLFLTFRPEFASPWIGRAQVTTLTINRLSRFEVEALIDRVAGDRKLPADIRQDIVERADGIPLFVEEMTKAVLEAEGEDAAAHMIASIPSPALSVPASLHASLMARLDRLGEAKSVAQIGSAIGREFSYALLAPVTRLSEPELAVALDRLVQSGLMSRQGAPPHATYLFKHALVQDAAYGTLLREPRRSLHARIANVLESQFPDVAESRPELLARHFAEAGLIEKAASLWADAGQRSLSRSASMEAESQFKRAQAMIATLPGDPNQRRKQIKVQVGLANALMYTKSYTSPETKAAFEQTRLFIERAEALGEPLEDPFVMFSVLVGFWMGNFVAFNAEAVRVLAAQTLSLAEKHGAPVPIVLGHALLGGALVVSGDFANGLAQIDSAQAVYDLEEHSQLLAMRFGMDFGTAFLVFRASAHWALGYPDAASRDVSHVLASARRIGHLPTLMVVLHATWITQIQLGNIVAARAQADELVALAQEKGAPAFLVHGMADQACALTMSGQAEEAIILSERAIAADRALASSVEIPAVLAVTAKAHLALGQFDAARRCIDEAMTQAETSGERWWEAEIHRMAGEIEWVSPERDEAKATRHFERALDIARAQHARSYELRTATSLARLHCDQGRRAEAQALLAPIYGWFTEGFDTPDLKEAEALLIALA